MARRLWAAQEITEVAGRYPATGALDVSRQLFRTRSSVTSLARRLGIPAASRRTRQAATRAENSRTVDAGFFAQLNPVVAYVLGFLWAGGGVKTKHRQVLRIAVEDDRREQLARLLNLLGSRHQVQQYGHRLVVEIGNSLLVRSLLDKFGQPPGRLTPDPPLPSLSDETIRFFAQGHLDRSGFQSRSLIRWTGTPTQMEQLGALIQQINLVGAPTTNCVGRLLNIVWTNPDEVGILNRWIAESPLLGH
ncbi:MAG: hypothetical protein ACUVQG_06705 [Thermogutta sp.]